MSNPRREYIPLNMDATLTIMPTLRQGFLCDGPTDAGLTQPGWAWVKFDSCTASIHSFAAQQFDKHPRCSKGNRLTLQTTCLVVSHRRQLLEQADQILVMENGRITARGTFAELRKTNLEMQKLFARGTES